MVGFALYCKKTMMKLLKLFFFFYCGNHGEVVAKSGGDFFLTISNIHRQQERSCVMNVDTSFSSTLGVLAFVCA